jgi:hypothetical protein
LQTYCISELVGCSIVKCTPRAARQDARRMHLETMRLASATQVNRTCHAAGRGTCPCCIVRPKPYGMTVYTRRMAASEERANTCSFRPGYTGPYGPPPAGPREHGIARSAGAARLVFTSSLRPTCCKLVPYDRKRPSVTDKSKKWP